MARCYYNGVSNRGNQQWGNWTLCGVRSIEDNIVKYCRNAFGDKYRNMWINPVYFDDKYFKFTEEFFSEVGVELYPKLTNLKQELKRRGIQPPRTKAEWEEYSSIVWDIIHKDINENIRRGVSPIYVEVHGVRFSKEAEDFVEKIKSVKQVPALKEE